MLPFLSLFSHTKYTTQAICFFPPEYVDQLLTVTVQLAEVYSLAQLRKKATETMHVPPPICADYEDRRPSLEEAVELQQSRFSVKN